MFELICPECDKSEFMFYDEFEANRKCSCCCQLYEYNEWRGDAE